MMLQSSSDTSTLTGRIHESPIDLINKEILEPQFIYELTHIFPYYQIIEKVFVLEYVRMGLIPRVTADKLASILDHMTREDITADPKTNMSDISFAIEQYVEQRMHGESSAWHVDRSRNDFQACAQLMFGRDQLLQIVTEWSRLAESVYNLARHTVSIPMPAYTHYQAAQIISPGFYLSALHDHIVQTLDRLLIIYDSINRCPLGAGALAGQELDWDRQRMASLLAFTQPQCNALTSVASREWTMRIAGELSISSVMLSRFVTDLIHWGSNEYGFIDLPDKLAGISSAMPQKKNFPVLERIRGKTAHISSFFTDFILSQRNTPYMNLVEVSKEANSYFFTMCETMRTILKLLTLVVERLQFREDRMNLVCEKEFFGGFSLANTITLKTGISYRKAQVIAGLCIREAIEQSLTPNQIDGSLLRNVSRKIGFDIYLSDEVIKQAFDVMNNLDSKRSLGSTHPLFVHRMLDENQHECVRLQKLWNQRQNKINQAYYQVDQLLLEIKDLKNK